ncbi:MAG: hypothetical protein HOM58_23110 [Rhodospirillaceae bacterium]|jgi:hypothetical protein|nr:hypothetical protein [Rhodospirillaceae bacterium]
MNRDRKSRLSRAVSRPRKQCDSPTPETVAKLRYDVIARLRDHGRISARHLEIAEEIRSVHEAVGRGLFPTAQSVRWHGGSGGRRGGGEFFDRMTQSERYAWERRYLPWTHDLATEIAAGMAGTRWLQLIIDIVVDNLSLRDVETRYQLRHGTAIAYLTNGLDRYHTPS